MTTPRGTVLIIGDPEVGNTTLSMSLEKRGYIVDAVASGRDGLDRLRQRQVDAVVTERQTADMDGLEVCRQARDLTDAPILMFSGAPVRPEDHALALQAGATEYMEKPSDLDQVLPVVEALVSQRQSRGRAA